MEGTENWGLGRETAHLGAGSDMGGCKQSQAGRGTWSER